MPLGCFDHDLIIQRWVVWNVESRCCQLKPNDQHQCANRNSTANRQCGLLLDSKVETEFFGYRADDAARFLFTNSRTIQIFLHKTLRCDTSGCLSVGSYRSQQLWQPGVAFHFSHLWGGGRTRRSGSKTRGRNDDNIGHTAAATTATNPNKITTTGTIPRTTAATVPTTS